MLAARASNAFVCLRCELQLARRRLPAYPRRTAHATFSTSARRHDDADALEALSQAMTDGVPANTNPNNVIRIQREVQPLDRIKKRKGKIIRETSARLGGVKMMGDDADILVLREIESDRPAVQAPPEPLPSEPAVVPNILASLQQQNEPATPEEIHKRLDSLRPRGEPDEPIYVPLKAFVRLIRDLTNGFTAQQLAKFYSTTRKIKETDFRDQMLASLKAESEQLGTRTSSARTRTSWQPGTTPITRRLPGVDVSHNKRVPVSKQLLVDRIIRDIWRLVPLEEVEALGEIELSLKPWQIILLNAGDEETLLDQISSTRKAKIEIYQQQSILRITADKSTAEYAADDIEEALHGTESKKMNLKPWIPCLEKDKQPADQKLAPLYTEEDFDAVTTFTRASVQRMDNVNTLVIRGLDQSAVAEAERALVRLLPLKDTTLRTIDTHALNVNKGSAHLLPTSYDQKSVDFKHRADNLGRWALPVARKAQGDVEWTEEMAEESTVRKRHIASIMQSLQSAAKNGPPAIAERDNEDKSGIWRSKPTFTLSAEFGQVLHPMKDAGFKGAAKIDKHIPSQPLFTPIIPGLMNVLGAAQLQGARDDESSSFKAIKPNEESSLLYDFVAAPEQQGLEPGQTIPSLSIQVRTGDDDTAAALRKVSLGFQQHVHTVLLPGRATDVRFFRRGELHFRKVWKDKQLKEWIEAVRANITSGERLTAPDLSVKVPKWTITGKPKHVKDGKTLSYLFAGVRFEQSVIGSFRGANVTYNTTQASKMGAQGGSLNMSYDREDWGAENLLQEEDSLASFVEQSLDFVDSITEASSTTQPLAKKVLHPRDMNSYRKQRRAEEQVATASKTEEPAENAVVQAKEAQQ